MFEARICYSVCSLELSRVVQPCSNPVTVLAEQMLKFTLRFFNPRLNCGLSFLGKLHHCSEKASRSWNDLMKQPVRVFHCSISNMKCSNRSDRIQYCCRNITEHPPCFAAPLELGIPDCRLPYVFSKMKIFWYREQREGLRLIWPYKAIPVVSCPGFMALTQSFMPLSITFSNHTFSSCSPVVDIGFVKLTFKRLCGNSLQHE